ncbi:hypothetical protein [Streptomyces sp. Y1]|uniref:Uncharacterized protein n=1 Tax=Streptomyces sp. Y1 TaxID=3238634 RepID=A0AB39TFC1_9ACTN
MSTPENESAAPQAPQPPAPPQPELPEPPQPAEPQPQAPAVRRMPRSARVALSTVALLAVTAASAAVTVAVGKPADRAAAAAPVPTIARTAAASAGPTPSAVPVPVPTAAPDQPKPSSTVKGTVSDGRHEGDLRYFLLPIPAGGESYGPADGATMTDDEVAEIFGKQDGIMDLLHQLGYQGGATRMYRTADGKAQVTVTLLHLGSAATASQFVKGYSIKSQESIDIDGDPDAHGFLRKPKQQAYTGSMTGVSSQGDVQYTIDVEVKGTPDKALLSDLMKRQRDWLASGG